MDSVASFNVSQLSDTVYRIVEDDRFGENPFIYLIQGDDKLVLIDTGCGTSDILKFLQIEFGGNSRISPFLSRILVINTHNHYDHVGCNFVFVSKSNAKNENCLDLCASSAAVRYTKDPFNSLGFFVGSKVKPFRITRWLVDGEEIPLSNDENSANILKIFHTPGHTPDSLCVYYPKDNRLFVGDLIYRWAPILAIGVKACPYVYQTSVEHLYYGFVEKEELKRKKPMQISCGHIDDNLESIYLKKLNDLLKLVNSGRASCSSCSCWFKTYANDDKSLYFELRRFRFLDPILSRLFKLFYYCWK